MRRSTKFDGCVLYGLESIPRFLKEEKARRRMKRLKDGKVEKKDMCLIDAREEVTEERKQMSISSP